MTIIIIINELFTVIEEYECVWVLVVLFLSLLWS
jgi:hypothetical protein